MTYIYEYLTVEAFLACSVLVLLMLGLARKSMTLVHGGTLMVLGTAILGLLCFPVEGNVLLFHGHFLVNAFTQGAKILILGSIFFVLFMSYRHLEREEIGRFEFHLLVVLSSIGMCIMVSAADFITVFLGLEMQSLALYILVAFQRDRLNSSEAGLKYFVLGALSSIFLLYGISLLYGYTGTTDFSGLESAFKNLSGSPTILSFGVVLVLAGVAFKLSMVPFHMWTPDIYEGSPTPVTAFLSSAPKIAAFILMSRLLFEVFSPYYEFWKFILNLLVVLSMIGGALLALWQTNIKRLLAYSTISHMGFAGLVLLVGKQGELGSVLLYLFIYVTMSIGFFAALLSIRRHGKLVEDVKDLAGLSKEHPLLSLGMTILLFSMAGFPPFAGFFAKLSVFKVVIDGFFYKTAIAGLMASVIATSYYLRLVKVMYFDSVPGEGTFVRFDKSFSRETVYTCALSVIFVVSFIFYPEVLPQVFNKMSQAVISH